MVRGHCAVLLAQAMLRRVSSALEGPLTSPLLCLYLRSQPQSSQSTDVSIVTQRPLLEVSVKF